MELIRNSKIIDKKYREFFLPTILTAMSTSLILIVDGIIVSNMLGTNEFAAVNCCLPVQQIFATIATLLGLGSSVAISIARGRRESQKADQLFTAVILMFVAVSLILLLPQACAPAVFSRILTKDEILYPFVYNYYSVFLWSAPFCIFLQTMEHVIRAEGKPRLASGITIMANIINLALDVVFMGPLKMGIKGAALASVIGFGVGSVVSLCSFLFGKKTLHFSCKNLWTYGYEIIKTGSPAAMGEGLVAVKIFCLNMIVTATAGNNGMIAFSVCLAALSLISMFISGAAQTMMPILGIYYGEKDFTGVRMVLKRAFRILMICAVVVLIVLETAPGILLTTYQVTTPEEVAVAIPALRIYATSLIGVSVSFIMIYYYMTIEKQRLANIISVVNGLLIIVPCAYVLSRVAGINGVWFAFPITELITIFIIWLMAKGRIGNFYQIKEEEPSILDISFSAEDEIGAKASEQVMDFLQKYGINGKTANKIGVAIEEMTENIYQYSGQKQVHIDLRLKADAESLMLSFCDDGPEFDPTIYQPEEKEEFAIDNIMMLKAVSKRIEYQRVIGLNKTTVFFEQMEGNGYEHERQPDTGAVSGE